MRFIFAPIIIVLGLLLMKYTVQVTNFTGKIDWAEKYLGSGFFSGTYTLWRLVGLIFISLAALWLFGMLDLLGHLISSIVPASTR
jgi:hypothetical protein